MQFFLMCLNVVVCGPYDEAVEGPGLSRKPLCPPPPETVSAAATRASDFGHATPRAREDSNLCGLDAKPYHPPPPTITPSHFSCVQPLLG